MLNPFNWVGVACIVIDRSAAAILNFVLAVALALAVVLLLAGSAWGRTEPLPIGIADPLPIEQPVPPPAPPSVVCSGPSCEPASVASAVQSSSVVFPALANFRERRPVRNLLFGVRERVRSWYPGKLLGR